jgi:MerR family redox-sensitive transcriptional activator SoxR
MLQLQVDFNASTFSQLFCSRYLTIGGMAQFSISEVARQAGLRPSAIRYYEQVKILLPPRRVSGQRRYDMDVLYQLAVVRRAQEAGFSLDEIRQLFFGFRKATPISARWNKIAESKIIELNDKLERIRTMTSLLRKLQAGCRCETVDQCGAGILRSLMPQRDQRIDERRPPGRKVTRRESHDRQ